MLVRLTRSQIERVLEALAVSLDGEQWTIFQHYDAVRARNQLRAALIEGVAPHQQAAPSGDALSQERSEIGAEKLAGGVR